MKELIEALQILLKYGNPRNPTHCEHDIMIISEIRPSQVSEEDIKKLDELGFFPSTEFDGHFVSYRFGSA